MIDEEIKRFRRQRTAPDASSHESDSPVRNLATKYENSTEATTGEYAGHAANIETTYAASLHRLKRKSALRDDLDAAFEVDEEIASVSESRGDDDQAIRDVPKTACNQCSQEMLITDIFCPYCGANQQTGEVVQHKSQPQKKNLRIAEASSTYRCNGCAEEMKRSDVVCINCGTDQRTGEKAQTSVLQSAFKERRQTSERRAVSDIRQTAEAENTSVGLGLGGSVLLFFGVFAPLLDTPLVPVSLNDLKGQGIAVLVLAVFSLILSLARQHQGLWLTSIGSIGVFLWTYLELKKITNAVNEVFGLAKYGFFDLPWTWGAFLLLGGVVSLMISAGIGPSRK